MRNFEFDKMLDKKKVLDNLFETPITDITWHREVEQVCYEIIEWSKKLTGDNKVKIVL